MDQRLSCLIDWSEVLPDPIIWHDQNHWPAFAPDFQAPCSFMISSSRRPGIPAIPSTFLLEFLHPGKSEEFRPEQFLEIWKQFLGTLQEFVWKINVFTWLQTERSIQELLGTHVLHSIECRLLHCSQQRRLRGGRLGQPSAPIGHLG